MFVNAHDHLSFYPDPRQALDDMKKYQIKTLFVTNDLSDYKWTKEQTAGHQNVKVGLAIHPWQVKADNHLEAYEYLAPSADFIGEVGLDYYWAKEEKYFPQQRQVFTFFCRLARTYNKVLNIHTKGAEEDCLKILAQVKPRPFIVHWFSGPLHLVSPYLDLGAYFTISVDVGQSAETDCLIDQLPLDRLLVETDGPTSLQWLNGHMGRADDIIKVTNYVAQRRGLDVSALCRQIEKNIEKLFF